jgi:heptaprenyl diphosphate synthase
LNVKTVQLALLAAVASILFTLESLIPNPFPWMRLGLANVVTLLALRWWGLKEAMVIVILRVLVGSLLIGKFFHPVFLLSLAGGIAAALSMGLVMKVTEEIFSLIGISIIGSFFKNSTQLLLAYLLYVRHLHLFSLLPLFLFSSLIGGAVIGILSEFIYSKLKLSEVTG